MPEGGPAPDEPASAGAPSPGGDASLSAAPAPKPEPPAPPARRPPRGVRWWIGRAVPVAGLALMLACIYQLADTGVPWPSWRWGGGQTGTPPPLGPAAVVIDPGHGGIDTGATALGLVEKNLTLDVAARVARALEKQGVSVTLTRSTDRAVSLEERVRIGNAARGALFVSIHFNDAPSSERGRNYHATGVETYYSAHKQAPSAGEWVWTTLFGAGGGNVAGTTRRASNPLPGNQETLAWSAQEGASLAEAIQGSLVLATSAADRGTKERALYVTRRVRAPAVLVEGGFISHPREAKRLGEPTYRQTLADAIAGGIVHYLRTADERPPGA